MARKKLRKVLAWTLAATIAVSPVNMTWASESADLFSDSSENVESVEIPADETDSQQGEVDTQSIVSSGEEDEDAFIAEDPVDVFSAGDESESNEKLLGETKTITGEEELTVSAYEQFIFKPEEAATYCISTNKDSALVNIKLLPTSGTEPYKGSCTLKTTSGSSYPIYIAGTDGDVNITIKKVPSIKEISVDEQKLPSDYTCLTETVIDNEFPSDLPVTVILDDENETELKTNSGYIDGYGEVGIVYENSNGEFLWDESSGNTRPLRPTVLGQYKYHFFCKADPSVKSEGYDVNVKTFDKFFADNTVTEKGDSFEILLNHGTYIKNYDNDYPYNYGFKLNVAETTTYYKNFSDIFYIKSWNSADRLWETKCWEEDEALELQAGTYYMILAQKRPMDLSLKVTITSEAPQESKISNISMKDSQELPILYDEYLQCMEKEDLEKCLRNVEFEVDLSDDTSRTIKLGDEIEEYGELYISSFDRKEDGTQYTIGLSFDEDEYETPYYIDLNVAHVTDSGNEIGGLSNSEDSSKTYTFSGNDDARYFYIENKLDIAQTFKLGFVGHTEDADTTLLAATFNGSTWSYQKLWLDRYADKVYADRSVALSAGSKMYLGYFGDAASVELVTDNIQINSIKLNQNSQQILKGVSHLTDVLEDLYFEVEYKVNGKTYSVLLSPDESDDNPDNLSIEVLFDDIYSSVKELEPGMHRVKCCIPEISNEYRDAGELEVLSYTELFESPSSVGKTVSFDKTKTFRGMNYVGFNIPKTGSYKISFLSDNNYEGDYKFVAADINGCYTINSLSMMSPYGHHRYLDAGLYMVFAQGVSNITVSATTLDDLKTLYQECLKLDKTIYEEGSWEFFETALTGVKDFLDSCNDDYDEKELADKLNYLIYSRDSLIEKTEIDLSKNPRFEWNTRRETEIADDGTVIVGKYEVYAIFQCTDNEYHTIARRCDVIPMSVNSVDGKVSVIYFDATVTMNGKEFTSRKIIPTNTLKKDEKRNCISTEVIVESGVTNATVTGLDKINVKDILSPKEIEKYEDPNTKVDINISTKVTEMTETVSKEEVSKAETELDNIIKDIAVSPKQKKIEYFDISMRKNIKTGNNEVKSSEIKDTKNEVTVELELSEEARNVPSGFTRNFYVIRIHDSKVDRLDATRNGNNLSFKTNKFSTYAVAYVDVKNNTSSPSYPSTPSYPVTDVTLSHDKADLTKVGETLQLTATVKPSYADNKTITWKSSDEKVATVDKDGKVTAVANGTATITATSADGKHSATATIIVKIAPEKLTLTTENKMLTKIGDNLQITAKVEPDNAYDKLIWKSSDEKVATVDAEGKVTAVGNGEATITATTENGKFSESVTITVKLSNEPTINTITGYGNLKARSVTQSNNSIKVEWTRISGADGYIVYGSRCNGNGKVYKYKKLATITNGKTRTWTHTKLKKETYYKYIVKAYKLVDGKKVITDASVSIHAVTKGGNYGVAKTVSITKIGNKKNATEVILKKGKTAQITAVEVKKDKKIKHHRKLCYESSNTNVATVTSSGMIKATGKGSCTVWVYAQNGVYKAITVTVK